jgi:hypothetical protein
MVRLILPRRRGATRWPHPSVPVTFGCCSPMAARLGPSILAICVWARSRQWPRSSPRDSSPSMGGSQHPSRDRQGAVPPAHWPLRNRRGSDPPRSRSSPDAERTLGLGGPTPTSSGRTAPATRAVSPRRRRLTSSSTTGAPRCGCSASGSPVERETPWRSKTGRLPPRATKRNSSGKSRAAGSGTSPRSVLAVRGCSSGSTPASRPTPSPARSGTIPLAWTRGRATCTGFSESPGESRRTTWSRFATATRGPSISSGPTGASRATCGWTCRCRPSEPRPSGSGQEATC